MLSAEKPVLEASTPSAVLVGNPNVGKSLLFRNLTQQYVTVSNYPGTTIEIFRAKAVFDGSERAVLDTPGINDLAAPGAESSVTRRMLEADPGATIVQVADAKNLRRALVLTQQLAELGRPMVLVLNMFDELENRGGRIDMEKLADLLGIPVVATVATRRQGMDELIAVLPRARAPRPIDAIDADLSKERSVADLAPAASPSVTSSRLRLGRANAILGETYSIRPPDHPSWRVRLGFWAMHPVKGLGFLGAILLAVYWLVGLFGAGSLVDALEVGVFEQHLNPFAIRALDRLLPFPHQHDVEPVLLTLSLPVSPVDEVGLLDVERQVMRPSYQLSAATSLSAGEQTRRFLHDLLVGPYGTLTMALTYAFAIVLPIVALFFLVFGILEDSGYFPRMAILLNRSFRAIGLNGKAALPMILGLGCDHHGHHDDPSPRDSQGAHRHDHASGPGGALLGPAGRAAGADGGVVAGGAVVWSALMLTVMLSVGWLTARVFPRRAQRLHPRDPADAATATVERAHQDAEPARVVSA